MTTTTTTSQTFARPRALRAWLLWTVGFIAFPAAGVAGMAVIGRVDRPSAALLGGLTTGAVLGLGQALASSGRLGIARWMVATTLGMGAGLLLGAQAVRYGTTLGDLAVMGALTGALLGAAQALALPRRARTRWAWALAMPVLWATGWVVTTTIGVAVDEQFTLFGSTGAVTVSALLGMLLHTLLPPAATHSPTATHPAMTPATTGDPS